MNETKNERISIMAPQFHETVMGQRFFTTQLPKLTNAITDLAREISKNNTSQANSLLIQPAPNLDGETRERLLEIMRDPQKAEALANIFCEQVSTDSEKLSSVGFYMAKAIMDNSIDDLLIAVCGYRIKSLLGMI